MKARYDTKQYVELFHLLFLDFFGRKADKKSYILKGGCNLRFFLKSIRYSEDIDIDVHGISKDKLEDLVNGILGSKPFTQVLQVNGMAVEKVSAPKQTETTQRWKMLLAVKGFASRLNTKIEFSKRGFDEGHVFEPVDAMLAGEYGLTPVMANHYTRDTAFRQKVEALRTRTAVQARDVFDLYHLMSSGIVIRPPELGSRSLLDEAAARAMSVTFDLFKGQVVSYLDPEYQRRYDSAEVWDDIVLKVIEFLSHNPEVK